MDAAVVRRMMALVPERTAREHTGVRFVAADVSCRFAERVTRVAGHLHWMSPLELLGREEQQALGLLNAAGRAVQAADLEDDADPDAELLPPEPVQETPAA